MTRPWRRVALVVALVVVAYVLDVGLLSRLPLPGAAPDLLLVVVVALAFALGPGAGAVVGFSAGLLVDVGPPAVGAVGMTALLWTVLGYGCGLVEDPQDRSVLLTLWVAGVAALSAVVGRAALGGLLGDERVRWDAVPQLALTAVLYAVALAPFVVPGVAWLVRRLTVARML